MEPEIGVVLGSTSDIDKVEGLWKVLRHFNVPFEVSVISAHRAPSLLKQYCEGASLRGIKVMIGCAGLSAALPGVMASLTDLPVIGLPVASGPLLGMDALTSMAQMPPGVPVATVGIGGAVNAALLALRILACSDPKLKAGLAEYRKEALDETLGERVLTERGLPLWRREG